MGNTKKDLVEDLWKKPYSLERARIETRAKRGCYHDFDTESATPKVDLVRDLRAAGFEDLAQKTMDGGYDDERPTAAQEKEMRQQLGPEMFDALKKNPRQVVGEALAREIGRQIASELADTTTGPPMGFLLLIFDFGDAPDKFCAHVSNAQREGQIKLLREHLARLERKTN